MQEMRACCDVERESLGDGRGFMRPVAWSVVGLGMDAWLQDLSPSFSQSTRAESFSRYATCFSEWKASMLSMLRW